MPKTAQGSSTNAHPNVLKRNQACHQCRRRKLKCDAKRPCSTCVRSHAHAVAHASTGSHLTSSPECTYDEIAEHNGAVNESPRSRYEKLENRINELEALLRQKEYSTSTETATDQMPTTADSRLGSSLQQAGTVHSATAVLPTLASPNLTSSSGLDSFTLDSIQPSNLINLPTSEGLSTSSRSIIHSNWPAHLPDPELLRYLVELFFVFHPHSHRLLHAPNFMASLTLPPNHPKFPCTPVLHAICAVAALYTAAVTSPPLPNFAEVEPDEIFSERHRIKDKRPDSFAEEQAKLAKETADYLESLGEDLFRVIQARVVLSWFYWSHSKWVEVYVSTAHSLRIAVPLGLNMLPPLHSITKAVRPPSILPPARTIIEDEMRRNTFWLAYGAERLHGCGNGWAQSLDDMDVTQLLPLRGDQFEQGVLVLPMDRQWAQSPNLLVVHLENQVDSFSLYVKGSILISRVKTFNLRFRARHFAGDSAVASPYNDHPQNSEYIDPRGSQAFIELDDIVSTFRLSFPPHLRNPISDNIVDVHLYTACLIPHCAAIILHDPHADIQQSGCISALKILTSARAILDLIYNVWSTSFDISLLDPFCVSCWFVAGRVLVKFLRAAQEATSEDQILTLRAELDFVHLAISKVGERIPMAFRFAKMLLDLIVKSCGPSSSPPVKITFPRQPSDDLGSAFLPQSSYVKTSNPADRYVSPLQNLYEPSSLLSIT